MLFDKPVYVHLNNLNKQEIQNSLLSRKPAELEIKSTEFTRGGGSRINLTSAQLKRLQKALEEEVETIRLSIPVKQLTDPHTGFSEILSSYITPITITEEAIVSSLNDTKLSDVNTELPKEDLDDLVAVGFTLTPLQQRKVQLGVDATINVSKDGLKGEYILFLNPSQVKSVEKARVNKTGLRLKLSEEQLKKNPTF